MRRRRVGKKDARGIAEERIDRLFVLAEKEALSGNKERSRRYVSLALRIGERHKVRATHKRTYCGKCLSFFVPSRNVRVRTGRGRISMTCLECGSITRYPLPKSKRG